MSETSDIYGLDDLLGAYALDAVDAEERERVEDYLAVNPRAAAEVRAHREVATMLAFTGMDAPDGLWSRIERELGATEAAPPPGPELARVLAFEPAQRRRARTGTWLLGAAAAVAVVVAAASIITRPDAATVDPLQTAFASALSDRDSTSAELVAEGSPQSALGVVDQDGHGFVDASELPQLSPDETYQLWGVMADTGDVVSIGILGPNPELELFTVESEVAALAITIERSPGVVSDGNPEGAYVGELA